MERYEKRPVKYPTNRTRRPAMTWAALALLPVLLLLVPAARARAASPPRGAATPKQVDDALKRGVAWLWKQQKPGGYWENEPKREGVEHSWEQRQGNTWGGYSALAVYALLSAGEKPADPRMAKAIEFLKSADIIGTYALAIRCQVWYMLDTPDARKLLQEDATKLIAGIGRDGDARGKWGYLSGREFVQRAGEDPDHSVSQFGVLGLWAATQGGVSIPPQVWKTMDNAWRFQQHPDGGWSYDKKIKPKPDLQMTAAGVATLFILNEMIGSGTGTVASGNLVDPNIDHGMEWMAAHWGDLDNAYLLFGIERIGEASGYKYLGKNNWYAQAAELLVANQKEDGSWSTKGLGNTPLDDTCFAILCLSHGRAPVLINKLNYAVELGGGEKAPADQGEPAAGASEPGAQASGEGGADGTNGANGANGATQPATRPARQAPWNQKPRDVANLARFVGRNLETRLNWQIVNLNASAGELLDAPVLYLSGSKALEFTPEEEARLKAFVEQGGLILANADAPALTPAADPFSRSVLALGTRLFGGRFRQLAVTHPILAEQQFKSTRWAKQPLVVGLSNGVRELIVLLPSDDPGRAWQRNLTKTDPAAFELGADICLYAVDKQIARFKGQSHLVTASAARSPDRTVRVARVKVGDNWDPEPGGWRRLDAVLRNNHFVGLAVEPVVPDPGSLSGYKVAHLTGTTAFQFTPPQRKELAQFVAGGGTLVVDAAGGSAAFADAAEKELAYTFGGQPGKVGTILPLTHPVYAQTGAAITSVDYRQYMRVHTAGSLDAPRVRGLDRGDWTGVFFSREDLSGGLVGQPVDGVMGYSPQSATEIMRNIVLYAAQH